MSSEEISPTPRPATPSVESLEVAIPRLLSATGSATSEESENVSGEQSSSFDVRDEPSSSSKEQGAVHIGPQSLPAAAATDREAIEEIHPSDFVFLDIPWEDRAGDRNNIEDGLLFQEIPRDPLTAERLLESETEHTTSSGSDRVKKPRGSAIQWGEPFEEFDDEVSAAYWLATNGGFAKLRSHANKKGLKEWFYCRDCGHPASNRRKTSAANEKPPDGWTPVQLMLAYDPVPVIRKALEDVCEAAGIPVDLIPKTTQMRRFVQTHTDKLNGGTNRPSLADIEQMARNNSGIPPPDAVDTAFVVHSNFESGFRVVFSTRRLIGMSRQAPMYSIDATYKLNYHGFPVLVLGICDYRNHVFPVALALCGNERTLDFTHILQSLDIGARKIGLPNHSPHYVMADAASAITNAVTTAFPRAKRSMCWYHVKKNIEGTLKTLKVAAEIQTSLLRGLAVLQLAVTEECFQCLFGLMRQKYQPLCPQAVAYIDQQWIQHCSTWWEGYAERLPSTNNGIESANGRIKGKVLRNKLSIGDFTQKVLTDIMPMFSREMDSSDATNARYYEGISEVQATKGEYATAALWETAAKIVEFSPPSDTRRYLFALSRKVDPAFLCVANIVRYLNMLKGNSQGANFDELTSLMLKMYVIHVPRDATSWRQCCCSCTAFLKAKVCYHVIGVGIRLHLLDVSDRKQLPINRRPRRKGRPRKAKRALQLNLSLDAAAADRTQTF
ncbi:hypothetical protein FOZ60_015891 [Perkinsus olseni]|uniref:SWIM-type domain-containing protein n=1 Tax=Perkinsus olseni TaxID=32597 RepID=A0A7J6N5W6_PEROL|nr:hypothetical protein FOZ60_015891 [Perkinsus olseni]